MEKKEEKPTTIPSEEMPVKEQVKTKDLSPLPIDEKVPVDQSPKDKSPIPVVTKGKEIPTEKVEEKPTTIPSEKDISFGNKVKDKTPSALTAEEEEPFDKMPKEKLPSPVETLEKEVSVEKEEEKPATVPTETVVPVKDEVAKKDVSPLVIDEKVPVHKSQKDESPSPVEAKEKEVLTEKEEDKPTTLPSAKQSHILDEVKEKTPGPLTAEEKIPLDTISMKKSPIPVDTLDKERPIEIKEEKTTLTPSDKEDPVKNGIETIGLSPLVIDEKAPLDKSQKDESPSPVEILDKNLSVEKRGEKSATVRTEKVVPVKEEVQTKDLSPLAIDEKLPVDKSQMAISSSAVEPAEKELLTEKKEEKPKTPLSEKQTQFLDEVKEKIPSPLAAEEKAPLETISKEKSPSPVETLVELPIEKKAEKPTSSPSEKEVPVKEEQATRDLSRLAGDEKLSVDKSQKDKQLSPIETTGKELPIEKMKEKPTTLLRKKETSLESSYKTTADGTSDSIVLREDLCDDAKSSWINDKSVQISDKKIESKFFNGHSKEPKIDFHIDETHSKDTTKESFFSDVSDNKALLKEEIETKDEKDLDKFTGDKRSIVESTVRHVFDISDQNVLTKTDSSLRKESCFPQTASDETVLDFDDKLSSISTIDSGIIDRDSYTHTLLHGSSSEDVSKEGSLEEKYSYESTEKSEKKSPQTLKDQKLTLDEIESHTDKSKETNETETQRFAETHLLESVKKAFTGEIVQQGIKTEEVQSIPIRTKIDRVGTPPTVPVSPLPKTPSSYQDIKVSDGVQSELKYDKLHGSEETIKKIVHVGEDILTQKISTSTEKVSKPLKADKEDYDDESEMLSLLQTMGKIKTETDTVTKIIKEGENVLTQTITTVTTKEIISREDGTPQNVKTTIETTTLSKSSDGSTTTTTDTQTLLSECSSTLRSTSQMDLYDKDRKLDKFYLQHSDDKSESEKSCPVQFISNEEAPEPDSPFITKGEQFIMEDVENDSRIEDTIIDTDVSKKIIKENNIDIIETITTTTKKETLRIDDSKTIIRTTIETNKTKEYPDGAKDVQKNVEVKTEEITIDSSSNLDKLLCDFTVSGEPEESVSSETERITCDGFVIKRTILTKIIKTHYVDSFGVPKKLKTVTIVTTTDEYPDGSLQTKVDSSTSLEDVEMEDVIEKSELTEYTVLEDKSVDVNRQETNMTLNGRIVPQIITTTTTKEVLSTKDKIKKKLKTTVETVTESLLPDGLTEVTKDIKISISDYENHRDQMDSLDGLVQIGEPIEDSNTEIETITDSGVTIKRKTTTITKLQYFYNTTNNLRRSKTTTTTIVEDEHPDGSVITKTSEKVTILDEELKDEGISGDGISEDQIQAKKLATILKDLTPVVEDTYPDGTVITKRNEKVSIGDVCSETSLINEDKEPTDSGAEDAEVVEDTSEDSDIKSEIVKQGSITIRRTITTKTKRETLASADKNIKRVRTTVETTTVDEYPDGSVETTKDVKITISEFQKTSDSDLQAALQGFISTGKIKSSTDRQTNVLSENITQNITTYVTKEEFKNNETNEIAVKTVTETVTENAHDDGTVETTKDVRTQITYLPPGTGLDDWSPEDIEQIAKQPKLQEDRPKIDDLNFEGKIEPRVSEKPKKQRSPVGEITTDTETFTKIIKEGDNEITQTITVVTTKEVISPEKIKVTVETTTVSKGSDGITKTTKSTKTTISEFKEEYEEVIDTGGSEKSFSKLSSKTGDMRSSSAASDDLDHPGISTPPSDISSRGSRTATHIWGTESSGMYYSDDDGQCSPSSTKSQIAHSPRSNVSFELDPKTAQQSDICSDIPMEKSEYDTTLIYKDTSSSVRLGQIVDSDSCTSSSYSEVKSEVHVDHKRVSKTTEEFLSHEKLSSGVEKRSIKSDATFLKEADEQFEKAIEEHKKVSGSDVISSITAKYELDQQSHSISSHQMSTKEENKITLKDLKSESRKTSEATSSSTLTTQTSKYESRSSDRSDPIESWGKPLGLPSPIQPPNQSDGKNTPKKQVPISNVQIKNKINQEKSKEAKNRASESPSKKKSPSPVYMELTYVPHHGNSYYSALEFFKRVRARYYVFSGTEPSKEIYNALLDAKKTWEDKELEVTIIPTYDTDVLGYWVTENEEALEKFKIDLSPSASRCTINLQDHETSCAAYRLEF
ncbi:unnamed protein product, partial [Iphiclides podalirius]